MGCHNSVVVNAEVSKVWDVLRNFHDLSWSPNVVESCEVVGDTKGDQLGAKRVLNNAFHETLKSLDHENHNFTYSIDDGPGPLAKDAVTNYVGKVQLHAITEDNTTLVVWTSRWDSGEGVAEVCNPVYVGLLGDLKAPFAG